MEEGWIGGVWEGGEERDGRRRGRGSCCQDVKLINKKEKNTSFLYLFMFLPLLVNVHIHMAWVTT